MAEEPSTFHKIWGTIIDPGGDPGAIRRAADACRKLSTDINDLLNTLDPVAAELKGNWRGSSGDGFQQNWAKFKTGLTDYAKHLGGSGQGLDEVADAIHEAQIQARNFKIMVGVTLAAGAAMTFFTFGTSDAAAIAAVEAEAGVMATMFARLGALIAGEAEAVSALISAFQVVAARFLLGAGFSLAATLTVKGIFQHENVLDPANYSAKDATNLLLGGTLTVGLGSLASMGRVRALIDAHPIYTAGAAGVLGGGSGSAIVQTWLDHKSLFSWDTLGNIALSAGLAGAAGLAIGTGGVGIDKGITALRGIRELPMEEPIMGSADNGLTGLLGPAGGRLGLDGIEELPAPRGPLVSPAGDTLIEPPGGAPGRPMMRPGDGAPLFPADMFPRPGFRALTPEDVVRGFTGIPAGAAQYVVNGVGDTPPLAIPDQPPPVPSASDFPVPPVPPPPPPPVPPLQPHPHPHPNPGPYTVHPGDSLWAIAQKAYGDGRLWTNIWQANPQISNPDLIHPGDIIEIPPLPQHVR